MFMCMHLYLLFPPLAQAPLKAKLSSSPLDACSTCKLVAQLLKGFIDNNKTEVRSVRMYIQWLNYQLFTITCKDVQM